MADIYVKKELYEKIVLLRADVSEFVNDAVREKLEKEGKE
jgi:post-segregation antitoxin (ccd killing protein)